MTHCETKAPLQSVYGSNVFSDAVMRETLPKNIYRALKRMIDHGEELDANIADVVANAMKDWAIEKGATHFTHWFQPMTGITAEKHDSFISPTVEGRTIMEFGGKELIKGEPDASSFPSGGIRATFEARGYTAWDCTSPAFVKAHGSSVTLYIPTAFCSYNGLALDKKTPLLRSMEALNRAAMRMLKIFGNTTARKVVATAGPEQEYFLIDEKYYRRRLDLITCGRTLFGAPPPKGQEMEDHYFGSIKERVASFMNEVNHELWTLGVPATTQHNEVSPAQFELAIVYNNANLANDHNQLTMEILRKVALRHGMVCLLHEKPFEGVNGSGKHNNWSMATDDGQNLLEPGHTPHENAQFLVFLFAVIRAVDKHAKLLRSTVATAGNDHRLGANEAPPAIVSIFLGEQLTDVFEQFVSGRASSSKASTRMKIGVTTIPPLPKDTTDRNRTSPFAFTGNKFEFRMVGSASSIAGPNYMLNTMVADVLMELADELEGAENLDAKVGEVLSRLANEHKRVIFNGNNYSKEWAEEAVRRGLPNQKSAVESLESVLDKDTMAMLERHGVLNHVEYEARIDINLEAYSKMIKIEALTMIDMADRQIVPAVIEFSGKLATAVNAVTAAGGDVKAQKELLNEVCAGIAALRAGVAKLKSAFAEATAVTGTAAQARACRDKIIPAMVVLRAASDKVEKIVDVEAWPLPTYVEMLFLM